MSQASTRKRVNLGGDRGNASPDRTHAKLDSRRASGQPIAIVRPLAHRREFGVKIADWAISVPLETRSRQTCRPR